MKKLIILLFISLLGLLKQSQQSDYQLGIDNPIGFHTEYCKHQNFNKLPYNPNETIYIFGINNTSRDKLLKAEKIIKDFYKFNTIISDHNFELHKSYYKDYYNKVIDCDVLVRDFVPNAKLIYITDEQMWGTNTSVRGYTTLGGNVIVSTSNEFMRETIIHEIGHTYGLSHCNDLTCIMAIYNDAYDSGTFCKKCKTEINY